MDQAKWSDFMLLIELIIMYVSDECVRVYRCVLIVRSLSLAVLRAVDVAKSARNCTE